MPSHDCVDREIVFLGLRWQRKNRDFPAISTMARLFAATT
jgi:hypothetical protein